MFEHRRSTSVIVIAIRRVNSSTRGGGRCDWCDFYATDTDDGNEEINRDICNIGGKRSSTKYRRQVSRLLDPSFIFILPSNISVSLLIHIRIAKHFFNNILCLTFTYNARNSLILSCLLVLYHCYFWFFSRCYMTSVSVVFVAAILVIVTTVFLLAFLLM